jgi:hypothetical membrane protein
MERRRPRNRGSQLLAIAAILVTLVGAFLAIDHKWYGLVLLGAGLVSLIAVAAWSIRNWEY